MDDRRPASGLPAGEDAPVQRILFHVDMDAFYAGVEERDRPELREVPVVVGADPRGGRGRGVVCTANYPARRFGIRSAMPISQAYRAAPHAVYLRPDFRKYSQASRAVMAILARYAEVLEVVGMDEAYLDVTARCHRAAPTEGTQDPAGDPWDRALDLARSLQAAVRRELRLSCSIGIAPTKSCAKVASDFRKPHGITRVRTDEVTAFLSPLPCRKLHGCGPKTALALADDGIRTVADLVAADPRALRARFGSQGDWLQRVARGHDPREVHGEWGPAKSRGNESTFQEDQVRMERVQQVAGELLDELLDGRDPRPFATVTVKVRYRGFETLTRARTLPAPLGKEHPDRERLAHATVASLLEPLLDGRPVRLVGVRLSGFRDECDQAALARFGVEVPSTPAAMVRLAPPAPKPWVAFDPGGLRQMVLAAA